MVSNCHYTSLHLRLLLVLTVMPVHHRTPAIPYIAFYGISLFNHQKLLKLVIISFILMTFSFDSRIILQGEIRSWSLLRVKGLKRRWLCATMS